MFRWNVHQNMYVLDALQTQRMLDIEHIYFFFII